MSRGWEYAWKWYADEVMHRKTRRCKLHIWLFLVGDGVKMHVRTIFPWPGFRMPFLRRFWLNLAFVLTYFFWMKSTESFIHEAPVMSLRELNVKSMRHYKNQPAWEHAYYHTHPTNNLPSVFMKTNVLFGISFLYKVVSHNNYSWRCVCRNL